MSKKIVWLILAVLLVGGLVYGKYYYPYSQLHLKNLFKGVVAVPAEHFYNATEGKCGVWYESNGKNGKIEGIENAEIKKCFQKSFEKCEPKNIFLVDDKSNTEDKKITYSLIRIIRSNDAGQCIVQNYFEEQNLKMPNAQPLFYINTCTDLSEGMLDSCEPAYIKDARANLNATRDTEASVAEKAPIEVQTTIVPNGDENINN